MSFPAGPYEPVIRHEFTSDFVDVLKEVEVIGPVKPNGWQTHFAKVSVKNMSADEAIAMGHLFAAAPEMYDLLQGMVTMHMLEGKPSHNQFLIDKIEAVLKKAQGEK